jgi:hypothetical protein
MASSQAAAQELWRTLEAALHASATPDAPHPLLPPLRALHAARQRLGDILDPHAAALADALQRLSNDAAAAAEGWPLALELLSRWCAAPPVARLAGPSGPQGTQAAAQRQEVLAAATGEVLRSLVRRRCPPAAVGPSVAFLGAAAAASGEPRR